MSFADSLFLGGEQLIAAVEGDSIILRHIEYAFNSATRSASEAYSDDVVQAFVRQYDEEEMGGGSAIQVGDQQIRIVWQTGLVAPKIGDQLFMGTNALTAPQFSIVRVEPVYSGLTVVAWLCQARG